VLVALNAASSKPPSRMRRLATERDRARRSGGLCARSASDAKDSSMRASVDRFPGIEIIVLGDLDQNSQYRGILILGVSNSGGSDIWEFWDRATERSGGSDSGGSDSGLILAARSGGGGSAVALGSFWRILFWGI
jgi:hypothetical protein